MPSKKALRAVSVDFVDDLDFVIKLLDFLGSSIVGNLNVKISLNDELARVIQCI